MSSPEHLTFELALVATTVCLVIAFAIWLVRRAGLKPRGTVIAQYAPPAGVDVLEAAYLVGRDTSAIEATIVDLAVRRVVRIVREPTGGFELELLSDAGRSSLEQRLVNLLFGLGARSGATRLVNKRVQPRRSRWSTARSRLTTATRRLLETRGLLRRRRRRIEYIAPGAILFVLNVTFFGGIAYFMRQGFDWIVPLGNVYVIIALVIAFWLALKSDTAAVTPTGAALRDVLKGLKLFIEVAEAQRLRLLQGPRTAELDRNGVVRVYERLLPFAVLWGLETEWARALRTHLDEEPDWWFESFDDFGSSLSALSVAIAYDSDAGGGHDGYDPGDNDNGSDGGFDGYGDSGGADGGGDGGGGDGGGGGD